MYEKLVTVAKNSAQQITAEIIKENQSVTQFVFSSF